MVHIQDFFARLTKGLEISRSLQISMSIIANRTFHRLAKGLEIFRYLQIISLESRLKEFSLISHHTHV